MKAVIIDIESIGEPFTSFDENTRQIMTRYIRKQNLPEEAIAREMETLQLEMGLSALTGRMVALGLYDAETLTGTVYFDTAGTPMDEFEEGGIRHIPLGERDTLARFWEKIKQYQAMVTFNGWSFDGPFLMHRSAMHRIQPSRNLMSSRHLHYQKGPLKHYDLQDLLSYQGAVRRKGSLHLWCRAMGIESPKIPGESGDDVARMYADGQYASIARYNARDLIATKALWDIWQQYLSFEQIP